MRYLKAFIRRIVGVLNVSLFKIIYLNKLNGSIFQLISASTKFDISNNGKIILGKYIGTRRNVEFRVSDTGMIKIGNNCFFNNGCIINSKEKISIGYNTQFGPNVMVFDHDHDFRVQGGLKAQEYKKTEIKIGNNVWIGANSVILRGSTIGDNCIIGAGSVINGIYESNNIVIQKRETTEVNIY